MNHNGREGLRTWIEIDRKAIRHNFNVFKKLISKRTKLMAVVKSNAYGHGLVDFSREMERLGADWLGVDSMTEARMLRREGLTLPILVLGYTLPGMIREAAAFDISLTVSSMEMLRYCARLKLLAEAGIVRNGKHFRKPLKIHLKVDTGMHRQGFLPAGLPKILSMVKPARLNSRSGGGQLSNVSVEGLYTHFAAAKNPAFPKDTKDQIAEFKRWTTAFRKAGLNPITHAAATAGTLLFPESHFGMVRVGIGLYGLWPERAVGSYFQNRLTLRPALVWKSIITEIKTLPKGSRIGYDLTEELWQDSTVAVVPVGYWHGYPRSLSSIGRVIVRGKECKVLGRVSMDMLSVDVSAVPNPKAGDEVIVMGGDDNSPASAAGLARALDASWYEIITRLNPLIKRIYH